MEEEEPEEERRGGGREERRRTRSSRQLVGMDIQEDEEELRFSLRMRRKNLNA